MRSERLWIRIIVAMVVGAGAAWGASIPAFVLGVIIADRWLPRVPDFHPGELVMALAFLPVLASALGLPGAFLGARSGSWRACYAFAVTGGVGAAISAFPCAAGCLFSRESVLRPATFTILFGLTVGGFFSGLTSHMVAASLQRLTRE